MDSLLRDIRYGFRRLVRDRVFTLTAVATLGACLAANAFVFSIVYSVLLSPLPVPESDRIVTMYNSYPNVGAERAASGATDYYDRLETLADLFEEQALYRARGITLGDPAPPQRIDAMEVTPSFFRLLQITPQLGRGFTPEEGEPGNEKKVILSHALWQQSFGGRADIVGQNLRLNGVSNMIVGVMGPEFIFVDPGTRLWVPLAFTAEERGDVRRHSNVSYEAIGRLRPSATLEQVRAQLDALIAANHERFPQMREPLVNAGYTVKAFFLKDELVRQVRPTLFLLWGSVLFVLAIGFVNLANLALARTSTQARELGTRFALGASLAQVARQQLAESLLLGLTSGGLGLLFGWVSLQAVTSLGIDQLPRGSEVVMTPLAAAAVMAAGALIGLLLGLIPVAQSAGMNVSGIFRDQARLTTAGRKAQRLRSGLVVAQVGIAFTLLLGAGLLLASFREVLNIETGFRQPETLMTALISPPASRYPDRASIRSFSRRLLEQLQGLPAVQHAALASSIPFNGDFSDSVLIPVGYEMQPGESVISPTQVSVSPDYFQTMGIPLLEGRFFDSTDSPANRLSIIIDERLARHFWKDKSPLGRELFFPDSPEDLLNPSDSTVRMTVVGVVGSVKERALVDVDERFGTAYQALEQQPRWGLTVVLKTGSDPRALLNPLRDIVGQLDSELPVFDAVVLADRIDQSLVTHRTPLLLALAFGVLALFLSAVGIYGVLGYLVAQRTNEIGIRIALGGDRKAIFALIFRHGVALLVGGLALGLIGILSLNKLIAGLLYGVTPLAPSVILPVAALLAAVALLACLIPALRATRVDPVRALNV